MSNNVVINKEKNIVIKVDNRDYIFNYVEDIKPIYKEKVHCKEGSELDRFIWGIKKKDNYHDIPLVKSLQEYNVEELMQEKMFVEFEARLAKDSPGVYIWCIDNDIKYIDIIKNLKERIREYGHICPDNIFKNGRSTNCRINLKIGRDYMDNSDIKIYFYDTTSIDKNIEKISKTERRKVEKLLINYFKQEEDKKTYLWNINH